MITCSKRMPHGKGLAKVLVQRAATVTLDWDTRQKSRFDAVDSTGRSIGVFLPRGTVVRGGDVLVAEDGSLVVVQAADQAVMVVSPCAEHGSPFDLIKAAYHLGNRHVALELQPDRLAFEPDHVLADMLRKMHLVVSETQAPFEPESGAYAATAHGHSHEHPAEQPPSAQGKPVPIAVRPAAAPHVHGPGCQHGHDHDPSH